MVISTGRGTPAGASLFFIGINPHYKKERAETPADGLAAAGKGKYTPHGEKPAERATEAAAGICCKQQRNSKSNPRNIRKKFNLFLTHSKNRRIMEKEKDSGKGQRQ